MAPLRIGFALAAALCIATSAVAKLPPLSDEAKAKAAEAAAKAAWSDKVAAFQLCKAQDAVAASYYAGMKKADKPVKPPEATPPCADPGPFAYAPPPPLEAAGAHSPAATAAAPPSTKATEAEVKGGAKK